MEIQLQELLDKIKSEGVEAARVEAARLLAEAEAKRKALLEEAEREARALVEKARADAARAEESGKAALSQASRDLILSFRDQLRGLLDAVVRAETAAAFGPAVLTEAIPAVLKAIAAGGGEDLKVLLPPAMLSRLEGGLAARLSAELKKGVELKPIDGLDSGFRISEKGGAAYYDFSAQSVAELLSRHLNARLSDILKQTARGI
jgi:V/A-type H+/Na+-transporting ATPase subunit E